MTQFHFFSFLPLSSVFFSPSEKSDLFLHGLLTSSKLESTSTSAAVEVVVVVVVTQCRVGLWLSARRLPCFRVRLVCLRGASDRDLCSPSPRDWSGLSELTSTTAQVVLAPPAEQTR